MARYRNGVILVCLARCIAMVRPTTFVCHHKPYQTLMRPWRATARGAVLVGLARCIALARRATMHLCVTKNPLYTLNPDPKPGARRR